MNFPACMCRNLMNFISLAFLISCLHWHNLTAHGLTDLLSYVFQSTNSPKSINSSSFNNAIVSDVIIKLITSAISDSVNALDGVDSYSQLIDDGGSSLCAVDRPSSSVVIQLPKEMVDIPMVGDLPGVTECGYKCSKVTGCTGFNYRGNATTYSAVCDMYNFIPNSFNRSTKCLHFGSTTEVGCLKVSSLLQRGPFQVIDARNCSFPFTFKGKRFSQCMENVTKVTNICQPYACLMTNRTLALCGPPADLVVEEIVAQLQLSNDSFKPTISVFGWTVIFKRDYSDVTFSWERKWAEYRDGFGSVDANYWLGLQTVFQLNAGSSAGTRLRIEVQQLSTGLWFSAEYWTFSIADETNHYQLYVSGYSGDAGDSLQYAGVTGLWNVNRMGFTTSDVNSRQYVAGYNCANSYKGGWWFNYCCFACLTCTFTSTGWNTLTMNAADPNNVLSASRMMIKGQ